MGQIIIAIDPDTDKNGIAYFTIREKGIKLLNLKFFELFDFLKEHNENIHSVIVEASWLIKKANWHDNSKGSKYGSRIGSNTGANHETGKKIVEMLEYLNIPIILKKPLKKVWKGKDGKITNQEFTYLLLQNSCKLLKRTNQEQRDAFLLLLSEYQLFSKPKRF